MTYLKKQVDLYLQWCELDRDFTLCLVQEEMVKTGFFHEKVSARSKCLQAIKHVRIGGKRHYTNQSQNDGKPCYLVAEERGKLWE